MDGTDTMADGICRLIISFLPKHRKYYGTYRTRKSIDCQRRKENKEEDVRMIMEKRVVMNIHDVYKVTRHTAVLSRRSEDSRCDSVAMLINR
jgi:hypothetical protein